MAFRVAEREAAAAIVLVLDLHDDLAALFFHFGVNRIGIFDDNIGALRGSTERRRRFLLHAKRIVARAAQHDHAGVENQLGMGNAPYAVFDNKMTVKTDGPAELVDHFSGIVPCGLPDLSVTSIERVLGHALELGEVAELCAAHFCRIFERQLIWSGPHAGSVAS